ncbi:acriflavin resistance protein [Desulfovibrio sp. X2]|uniref:efflux RND transporter permease subunit n=1 Tax=Desulfovibrio sp. X2 TaxID=941449 RepID=UPI00035880AF|nr:efflux RND transporter permease subunit [Desulfovibrio sp. X2]EPR37333.1 acriflavin resistance protein [Desulfovibrio sp. X2]
MTDIFIRRPVATALIVFGLLFLGLTAYDTLPVSEMPAIDFPTIQVTAQLPGADPETMASSVATPLEKQFTTVPGINSMSSVNTLGRTTIVLQFDLGRNIDGAGSDVQTAISAAQGYLPPTLPNPPTYQKVNPADSPILFIGMHSDTLPLYTLTEYAKTYVSQRISMVAGVAQVAIYGDQTYAPHIQLDPDKLAALNLPINAVAGAFQSENVNLPVGTLYGKVKLYTIKARGMLMSAKDYIRQIIAWRGGTPVRLSDVGTAIDSTVNDHNLSFHNQSPSITLAVRRQPGTNTIEIADNIRKLLPAIQASLPTSVQFEVMYDRSQTIRDSVQDVKFTLALAVVLVVAVVFLFLRNVRATIISCVALPAAIIGTFALMKEAGFSLDNLSLLALILAVGFVVDDAIVMLENIVRHMEMGKPPYQAALDGARQIGFTIISMTLSLAVVFVPVMFMAGILGRILNELAVTITMAILVSGFLTLSFTPMLCSQFLRHAPSLEKPSRLFSRVEKAYEASLHFVLGHRFIVLMASFGVLGLTLWMFAVMPMGFIPTTDSGFIYGYAQGEQSASFDAMKNRILRVSKLVEEDPDVHRVVSIVGVGGPNTSMNNAAFFTLVKPANERPDKADIDTLLAHLRRRVAGISDLRLFMFNPPAIQIGGRSTRALYQFTMLAPETDKLYAVARRFEASMRALPEVRDVNSDMQIDGPQVTVHIDRDKASSYGISAGAIETALWSAYGSRQISNIYASTDTYRVVIEVLPEFQRRPDLLSKLYVQPDLATNTDKNAGKLVPLDSLVTLKEGVGPITVNHTGQLTSVTISFNTAAGHSLSQATEAITALAHKEIPPEISYSFQGQATAFQESAASVPFLLLLAIVVIYIILGVLYESFIHPLTILSGLPSAALGGLLALLVFGRELDLYGFVGIIMLIGIVKKNAIMVVDFAIAAEKEGKSPIDAVFQGCVIRFRPIMMTTVAAIAGILPIALAYGAGGIARQPLGLVVAGGLAISQVVTLYLTPVMYTYLDDLQQWLKRKRGKAEST